MTTTITVALEGPGTFAYNDSGTSLAITALKEAVIAAQGPTYAPLSQADALNRLTNALVSTGGQQVNALGKFTSIEAAINNLSITLKTTNAILGQAVAVQTLAVAEQIKNNKFTQTATNAALTRSKLPPVVVQPADAQTAVTEAITSAGTVSAQAAASGFVTNTIAQAGTFMVQVSGIETAFNNVTGFVGGKIKEAFNVKSQDPTVIQAEAAQKQNEALCKR